MKNSQESRANPLQLYVRLDSERKRIVVSVFGAKRGAMFGVPEKLITERL